MGLTAPPGTRRGWKQTGSRVARCFGWALLATLPLASCLNLLKPHHDFVAYTPATGPNYALDSCWAALPTRRDSADALPKNSGLRDEQATAAADVFFVHPTTFYRPSGWNADLSTGKLNRFTDRSTIRHQASAFNAAASTRRATGRPRCIPSSTSKPLTAKRPWIWLTRTLKRPVSRPGRC